MGFDLISIAFNSEVELGNIDNDIGADASESTADKEDSADVLPSAPDVSSDEIQTLLSDIKDQDKEYYTEMQEKTDFLVSQSRNLLSVSALCVLVLSFASGVLLARLVWRKI